MTSPWGLGDQETRRHQTLRIVIESVAEKSLSLAVRRSMFGKFKMGNLLSADFRASFYLCSAALPIYFAPHLPC